MIDYDILEKLVVSTYEQNPLLPVRDILPNVEKLAVQLDLFPDYEECQENNIDCSYYQAKKLNPTDIRNVNFIIQNIIRDRMLLIDEDRLN